MISAATWVRALAPVGLVWLGADADPRQAERPGTDAKGPARQVTQLDDTVTPAGLRRVQVHITLLGPGVTEASVMQLMERLIEDFAPWSVELELSYERDLRARAHVVKRLSEVHSVVSTMQHGSAETFQVYVAELQIDEDGNGVPDFTAAPIVIRRADGGAQRRGVIVDPSVVSPHNAELTYQLGVALGLWTSPDDPPCQRLRRRRQSTAAADRPYRTLPIVVDAKEER